MAWFRRLYLFMPVLDSSKDGGGLGVSGNSAVSRHDAVCETRTAVSILPDAVYVRRCEVPCNFYMVIRGLE
jgi:hypothetical protein